MWNGITAYSYDSVYLVPRYSELRSRSEADISVEFLGRRFRAPVVPANMESVINVDIAKWLSENDLPYIYHRFGDTRAFIERANKENWKLISISVGVKDIDKDLLDWAVSNNLRIDWICVDVAHGNHILVKEMIALIKATYDVFSKTCPKIIAGNVATSDAVRDVKTWGADSCKCGISGGGACSTKTQTGFHLPMFSCAMECASDIDFPLIIDGSVRHNGDIAKAIVAVRKAWNGHSVPLVMCGSLFAACKDAPGENVYKKGQVDALASVLCSPRCATPESWGKAYETAKKESDVIGKRYHGSASRAQKGEDAHHVEGFEVELPCNGMTIEEKYREITESLQSSVSYAGGKTLTDLRNVDWVVVK
jgi:GMP reductase